MTIATRMCWSSAEAVAPAGERYSTEVPQRTRTEVAAQGRVRTVTCTGTRVDVLPPDGMQEVSGSSPLSSTWSEVKFEQFEQGVQQESTATAAGWAAVRVFGSASSPAVGCWQATRFQGLNRRWSARHLGRFRRIGPVTFASWPPPGPPGRAIPASGCCRNCKWSGRAGRPGRCDHSREPRPLARTARSQTAGAARGLSAWRRWCQPGAGPAGELRHSGAELRRGAALLRAVPARWCAT